MKPTPETIDRTIARLSKPGAVQYFFDKLKNPEWLVPLHRRGFFMRPPSPVPDRDTRGISYPAWPELGYLQRMAEHAPDTVAEILEKIPETKNLVVRQVMLDTLYKLPPHLAAPFAGRVAAWILERGSLFFRPQGYAQFIDQIASAGLKKRSFEIAARLFAIQPVDSARNERDYLDAWHLERSMPLCLPALRRLDPAKSLHLVCSGLFGSIKDGSRESKRDYSYIWRANIERSNYSTNTMQDVWVNTVRDLGVELSQARDFGVERTLDVLEAFGLSIFTRLGLFILAETPGVPAELITHRLSDDLIVSDTGYKTEYKHLVEARFASLPRTDKEQILQTVLSVPSVKDRYGDRLRQMDPIEIERIDKTLLRDRLLAFGALLPPDVLKVRGELIEKWGELLEPWRRGVWTGPTSPSSVEELRERSVPEVIEFIRGWTPNQRPFGATPEGLGRVLQIDVKERSAEYSQDAEAFEGVDPTYVRALVMGLSEAVKAGKTILWEPIFALCDWVLAQPRGPEAGEVFEGQDPGWSWTRQSIAELFSPAFEARTSGLDVSHRRRVWRILEVLGSDPDPTTEREDSDPVSVSLNTVRGQATYAILRYAFWMARFDEEARKNGTRESALLTELLPEVSDALKRVLTDATPGVRCIVGEWFNRLFFADRDWATAHVDRIFPEGDDERPIWNAAWQTYLKFAGTYDPAYHVLRPKFLTALARIEPSEREDADGPPELALGEHLAGYYWRNAGGGDARDLLMHFIKSCSSSAAGRLIDSIGNALERADGIDAAALQRLVSLWEDVSQRHWDSDEVKRTEILRGFGSWFASGKLEPGYALRQLLRVLGYELGLVDEHRVMASLASYVQTFPALVAACVDQIVRLERESWRALMWQEEVEAVLRLLLASDDQEAKRQARTTADRLIEAGQFSIRALLKEDRE
jgi:hypothetical protein